MRCYKTKLTGMTEIKNYLAKKGMDNISTCKLHSEFHTSKIENVF